MRIPALRLVVLLLLLALPACDTGGGGDDDRFVAGVNVTALFAPPSEAEINAVLTEWAGRDVGVQGYQVVSTDVGFTGGTLLTVRVVSHTVGGVLHYGAVVVPAGKSPDSLPLLVYAHPGDAGTSVEELLTVLLGTPELIDEFMYVIPSFRSETLRFGTKTYTSGGTPSPWDRDVDDALALLNVAIETTPEADEDRIGVVGLSRGAGVGMLMAARDARIDRVVEFFGPTDFYGEFMQQVTEEALLGTPRDLPGTDYLDATFLQPLKSGALTIAQVRPELTRRSAVLFAERLPALQVHHGTADLVVAVSQAQSLIAAMQALGRTAPQFESYLYEGAGHDPFSMPGSISRAGTFLAVLTAPTAAS
jgi:dipeptidyl aminopeptidase/acylaminoacyl peptidase